MTHRNILRIFALFAALFLPTALAAEAQVGRNMGALNPNTATESELAELPHMDAAKADSIVAGRPFTNMLEVNALVGESLEETQRDELYARLFLPLNLNDASREEILLVPGVGNRMAHEFEEYKPYAHMGEFRREIGKYVDDDEVARLEQFVFVPIDLNEASDEEILTIPNLGERMLREFKEYRPYRRIEQFRREIGKYVDDDEVARLERYVDIPSQDPAIRIVFFGDSITEAGAFPGGYVTLAADSLAERYPGGAVEVIGAGISGNKVPDLQERLRRDVLALDPTHVVIYIGINDVWHSYEFDHVTGTERGAFEEGLHDLISTMQGEGVHVSLCTPSVIGEDPTSDAEVNRALMEYADISRAVAEDSGAALCDLRAAFEDRLAESNPDKRYEGVLTTDGVHLNEAGNRFVADLMLEHLVRLLEQ